MNGPLMSFGTRSVDWLMDRLFKDVAEVKHYAIGGHSSHIASNFLQSVIIKWRTPV